MLKLAVLIMALFMGFQSHVYAETDSLQYKGRPVQIYELSGERRDYAIALIDDKLRKNQILTDCSLVVDLPVTQSRYGNHSYGATCRRITKIRNGTITERAEDIMVCTDEMMGRIESRPQKDGFLSDPAEKKKALAEFVLQHCYGG